MDTLQYLEALWCDGYHHYIWTLQDRRSHWAESPEQAAEIVARIGDGKDVYFGPGATVGPLGAEHRPKADQVEAIHCLWADVDVLGDGHSAKHYPPTFADALTLIADPEPSLLIHSGGGWQAYWLLKEPWDLDSEAERERAKSLMERWQRLLKYRAREKGWVLDSTHDISRILRVPGTYNLKQAQPRAVRIKSESSARYNASDLEEILDALGIQVQAPQAQQPDAGGFVLRVDAQPPARKFALLQEIEPDFCAALRHEKPIPDPSPSGWDMCLANYAVHAGWTDQEVVDLLVWHRRESGQKAKLREDYYRRTLGKARASQTPETAAVASLVKPPEEPVRNAPSIDAPQPHGEARQAGLDKLSTFLGFAVHKVYKTSGDEPQFRFASERGDIIFAGAEEILSYQRFRARIYKSAARTLSSSIKGKHWDPITELIQEVACVEVEGDTAMEKMKRNLTAYLSAIVLYQSWDEALAHNSPRGAHVQDGRVWISADEARGWVSAHLGEKQQQNDWYTLLHAIGAKDARRNIPGKRGGTVRVWALPVEYFDPESYLSERKMPIPIRRNM